MRFSLIVCTINRREEVARLFESISGQLRSDLEVILVDQNSDDRLDETCDRFAGDFPIKHIRISGTGASRARNVGVGYATGDLIGFPDDDCRYFGGYLDVVAGIFCSDPSIDCICGSPTSDSLDVIRNWENGRRDLDAFAVMNRCVEFTIFIRSQSLRHLRFNERLGVGAQTLWGSEEGPDLLIRLVQSGCRLVQFPQLLVYHPDKSIKITFASLALSASYARGRGCLLRLHRFPLRVVLRTLFRTVMGACVYLALFDVMRSAYYFVVTVSILRGMFMSRAELAEVRANTCCQTNEARQNFGQALSSSASES
jgi:glycosyltransferase involved in cell wall biosynthesis